MEQQAETATDARIDEEDIRLTSGFADIFTAILLVVGGILLTQFWALALLGANTATSEAVTPPSGP